MLFYPKNCAKKEGCKCLKCCEVKTKKSCKKDCKKQWKDDWKKESPEKKWEKREGCKCFKCCEVEIKIDCKNDWKKESPEKEWEKREGCKCFKCCEVEIKIDCKDDWHEKKYNCHEEKWKDDFHEKKCNCHEKKCKDDCHEKKCNEHDCNCWIREKLDHFIGRRVVIFTNDATHTEGTVQDVKKDFVILVPIMNYLTFEPVKVFSNENNILLEEFEKYYIRLDDIVGFGKDSHKYT